MNLLEGGTTIERNARSAVIRRVGNDDGEAKSL